MNSTTVNLEGVARTLLVPLACRAIDSIRADAILRDPRAVEVYNALGGSSDFLMGIRGYDLTTIVMRARQFDRFACNFLFCLDILVSRHGNRLCFQRYRPRMGSRINK